ncbi:hypothetical protein A9Q84_12340 [Halobacteriovorax marinus]|uniref:Uncharacterized protein n=1 Tax=Halobacteriovorax marinus TaxID=97084 RepID=A0A1Y5FEU6_9BACT|nr:hypothetical protein A9Q84_12340 [Halobacteriovorax marinus]
MEEDSNNIKKIKFARFMAYRSGTTFNVIFNLFFFLLYLNVLVYIQNGALSLIEFILKTSAAVIMATITTFLLKSFKLHLNRRGVYLFSFTTLLLLIAFIRYLLNL